MESHCNCEGSENDKSQFPILDLFEKFPANKREYLIPLLQETQERLRYLPKGAMVQIARHVGVPVSKVYGVATFYNQFRLNPPGRHVIQVCRGTACHVRGSDQILRAFESELGIPAGQTTKDGFASLEIVACLGSCSIAPVITLDGQFHGRLVPKDVERIMRELRREDVK